MLEAVVGVALRAILASVVLGGVLAALVLDRDARARADRRDAPRAVDDRAVRDRADAARRRRRVARARVRGAAHRPMPARACRAPTSATSAVRPQPIAVRTRSDRRTQRPRLHSTATLHAPHAVSAAPVADCVARRPARVRGVDAARDARARARRGRRVGARRADRLVGLAASIVRVRGLKRRSSPLDGTLADELPWLTDGGRGREIYLRLSYETETPVAIGFRRPVILIPTELATADGLAAIEPLILHEHAHLRRYDDWTNLVQRTIERVFWFNPIVWLVGRRIALEREIASDDAVVEKTGEAHAYATSLWKLAREMRMPEHAVVAPGALLTRKQITVRIEQLLDKKRARLHRSPAAARRRRARRRAGGRVRRDERARRRAAGSECARRGASPRRRGRTRLARHATRARTAEDRREARRSRHGDQPPSARRASADVRRPSGALRTCTPVVAASGRLRTRRAAGAGVECDAARRRLATVVPPAIPRRRRSRCRRCPPRRGRRARKPRRRQHPRTRPRSVREATRNIGPEVARTLHEAMAAIPREIAQEAAVRAVAARARTTARSSRASWSPRAPDARSATATCAASTCTICASPAPTSPAPTCAARTLRTRG